jgi:catalase-peroxidase
LDCFICEFNRSTFARKNNESCLDFVSQFSSPTIYPDWPDNGNLDKALRLLQPIKNKYGSSLSWGDLIILSGTTAIEYMGGTILGFCGGRIDDADGGDSLRLGPSPEQEAIAPCQSINMQGTCLAVEGTAMGPTTVGLIYVNPEGPVGNVGNTTASAADIRRAFGRMGFNDVETVSLVGGGHAFGKAHGACTKPPCGQAPLLGLGPNVVTSGLEGAWTVRPTTWSNDYFINLSKYVWKLVTGPGGATQWAPVNPDGTPGPDIMMLTTDLALRDDPDYAKISQLYRDDITALESDFAKSWYRLTSQDMGPRSRCIGDMVPPAQPFQHELPPTPTKLPDYVPVRTAIQEKISAGHISANELINLAYRCAFTYRATDHFGGCNVSLLLHYDRLSGSH